MSIRVFSDRRCLEHVVPRGFPEVPIRLAGILDGLQGQGYEVQEAGEHPETDEAIRAIHDESYVRRFRAAVDAGEMFVDTGDNPLSAGSWDAARAAVDATLFAVDWTASGPGKRSFALVRPPGHHAERSMAMGFCYLNNVAIAAERLIGRHGVERVAILDFDVHHGNGTQHLFEERGDVLYLSTHQHPFYPGTGGSGERGIGDGEGATVNVPLPAGAGDQAYEQVFVSELLPAVRSFAPKVLLISAGFDAWQGDPVGGMRVTASAFQQWGAWLREVADEICEGRIFVTLEGGYDLHALPALVVAFCRGVEREASAD